MLMAAPMFSFRTVGSTQDEAFRLLDEMPELRLLGCRAERQEMGRGQRGRPWLDGTGNLMMSLAWRNGPFVTTPSLLSLAGAVALVAVLRREARPVARRLRVKWPNDVMIEGRKLAGVLVEARAPGGPVALGIGLNLRQAPKLNGFYQACALADFMAEPPEAAHLARLLVAELEALETMIAEGEPGRLLDRWERLGPGYGAPMRIETGRAPEATAGLGRYRGLGPFGELQLLDDQGRLTQIVSAARGPAGLACAGAGPL